MSGITDKIGLHVYINRVLLPENMMFKYLATTYGEIKMCEMCKILFTLLYSIQKKVSNQMFAQMV